MAERKKNRRRKARAPKKQNIIDKAVGGLRDAGTNIKKTVTGSKEVKAATQKVTGAASALKSKVPGAKAKAAETVTKVADTTKSKVKAATSGSAARANESIRARAAGPQQGSPVKQAAPRTAGGATTPPPTETPTQRATTRAEIDRGPSRPAAEAPKRSLKNRALRSAGRTTAKIGGPAAVAGLVDQGIQFGVDVADRGFDAAATDAVEAGGEFIQDLPENAADFGRQAINRPLRTAAGVGAGVLDTAANVGLTIGDAGRAAFQEGPFTENFNRNQAQNRSMRDPFGRMLEAVSPTDQQPAGAGAADAASQPPKVAGVPQEPAGVATKQPTTGLRGAASNREFLADEAGKFRSGFDVLKDAGVQATGGIGDLAAYNTATGIAKRENTTKKAGRELNVNEAKARSTIEGQNVLNTLRGARTRAANQGTDFSVQERVDKVGKEATSILDNYEQLKDDASGFFSDKEKGQLKNLEDTTINQALQSNFSPDSASSVAASQMLTSAMTPLMDPGVMESISNALVSSGFSAADILNDNGDLAVNRETINLMSVTQDSDGDTVVGMEVPTEDAQGNVVSEVRPLFFADELEPNMRDHMLRVIMRGTGQARTLQNAAR